MLVSLNGLKKYIDIEISPEVLASLLTMSGFEVESFYDPYAHLEKVIVCKIKDILPHPNADRLRICEVDTGSGMLSIVCGASNIEKDMLAPLALPGAELKDGFVIKESVIRKVKSYGMLCSEAELGLGAGESGILELDKDLDIGDSVPVALKLSDHIFDINITPNRPDCLSVIGIAREIGAITGGTVKYPDIGFDRSVDKEEGVVIERLSSITIEEKELCPRYAAGIVTDVKVGESPSWLADFLKSVGSKPINNIVDITNFVMLETGQPLHAFDLDELAENRIVVKRASENERFTTLDNKIRTLSSDMLMICDAEKPVAIAGVMGGLNSEIKENTTRILIESAYFNPVSVRRTSKKLGMSSDASYRFERGVDPDGTIFALKRAVSLISEIAGGKIINGLIDENFITKLIRPIEITEEQIARLLGTSIDKKSIIKFLESISFKVEDNKDGPLLVTPPSFRVDINRPVDIIEEVARLKGYDNIPTKIPVLPAQILPYPKNIVLRDNMKNIMKGLGFSEVINYTFINSISCDRLRLPEDDPKRGQVRILNPLTQDQAVMRSSIIPSLLETAVRNISLRINRLKIFEIGKTFLIKKDSELPKETEFIAGLWTGGRFIESWHNEEIKSDFYDIKGAVEGLLGYLHIREVDFKVPDEKESFFTKKGATAKIIADKTELGIIGEVDDKVLQEYGLKQKVFIFEIDSDVLMRIIPDMILSEEISRFPAVIRDLTFILSKDIEAADVYNMITSCGCESGLMEKAEIFDVYEGAPIPSDKRSISFRITYRAYDKTLQDEDIASIQKRLIERAFEKFKARLPV